MLFTTYNYYLFRLMFLKMDDKVGMPGWHCWIPRAHPTRPVPKVTQVRHRTNKFQLKSDKLQKHHYIKRFLDCWGYHCHYLRLDYKELLHSAGQQLANVCLDMDV